MGSQRHQRQVRCWICRAPFVPRMNVGRRARLCTPSNHRCIPAEIEARSGAKKRIPCQEQCCRSQYLRGRSSRVAERVLDHEAQTFSQAEYREFYRLTYKSGHAGAVLRFLAETGCRLGEALLVRLSDLRLEDRPPAVLVPTLKRLGRPARRIHLYTADYVHELKRELEERTRARRSQRGHGGVSVQEQFLFPSTPRRTIQYTMERILRELGIRERKQALTHLLRHTRATRLLALGAPPTYVQQQLGWSSIELLTSYAHADETVTNRLAAAMHGRDTGA